MSAEDILSNSLKEMNERFVKEPQELIPEFEKHYNYYGDRGVVDLFTRKVGPNLNEHSLYEVKSESAVNAATGANEIIRQFNRMCEYFYKGTSVEYPDASQLSPTAELSFVLTEETLSHVLENKGMYQTIHRQTIGDEGNQIETRVLLRSLDLPTVPLHWDIDEPDNEQNKEALHSVGLSMEDLLQ